MDLFSKTYESNLEKSRPLAARVRPKDFKDFVGQEQIVGDKSALRNAILEDKLTSAIFYGPPGSGKTTLARIISNITKAEFIQLSAVTSNVAELRKTIARASENLKVSGKKTIVFIDEIHRFNKSQQDALLPAVEDGIVTLIGATTENPYFEINSPLISRSAVYEFKPLSEKEIKTVLKSALKKDEKMSKSPVKINEKALEFLVLKSNGDARFGLNSLEIAFRFVESNGLKEITPEVIEKAINKKAVNYDKVGDAHYNTISAFIKSLRGSDPDAAVYYLARMLNGGEDPKFIARRMVIFASEDIGNADPQALNVAVNAAQALDYVGLPEARLNLAQAVIYLSTAPKSNAVIKAIDSAIKDNESNPDYEVPSYLQEGGYPGAKDLGRGQDYKYPHSYGGYVKQQYLPDELKDRKYYSPTNKGYEKIIKKFMEELK